MIARYGTYEHYLPVISTRPLLLTTAQHRECLLTKEATYGSTGRFGSCGGQPEAQWQRQDIKRKNPNIYGSKSMLDLGPTLLLPPYFQRLLELRISRHFEKINPLQPPQA
jgi:hypothetical protein